jgi:hypothetical protein
MRRAGKDRTGHCLLDSVCVRLGGPHSRLLLFVRLGVADVTDPQAQHIRCRMMIDWTHGVCKAALAARLPA